MSNSHSPATNKNRRRLWQQILDSSKALDQAAKASDWEALSPLIDKRLQLLQRFFSEPLATEHSKHLAQIQGELQTMLEQTDVNRSICEKNQEVVGAKLRQINKGKQAIAGYR